MRRLLTFVRNLLGSAPVADAPATPSASEPAAPPSFFNKLLGDAVSLTHLDATQRATVLQLFATDSSERLLRLEQHLRGNADAGCFEMLADIRDHIAAGTHAAHAPALEQQLRATAVALDPTDARGILWDSLLQLLVGDPEQIAAQTFFYTMLRMVRYGGSFVDQVRKHERAWHEARMRWWVNEGARLADIALAHTDEAAAGVPDEARMLHGFVRAGA